MATKKKQEVETVKNIEVLTDAEVVEGEPEVILAEETQLKVEPKPQITNGQVVNCSVLRIRKAANAKAEIVKEIIKGTIVKVNIAESTPSFYKVKVDKVSGFCMRDYIKLI